MKSADYLRRKKQIFNARLLLSLVMLSILILILSLSVLEWYTLFDLLENELTIGKLLKGLISYVLFSFLFSICLARISLHIVYFFEHAKVALAVFSLLLCVLYFLAWRQFADAVSLFYLGVSKITSLILFLRFWDMLLSEMRLQTKLEIALQVSSDVEKNRKLKWAQKIPKDFLKNFRDFIACKWVVVGCFFLNLLGFIMALCSHSSVGLIQKWEGLVLIALYFSVYLVFLRNPGGSTPTA